VSNFIDTSCSSHFINITFLYRATKEQEERIHLIAKRFEKIKEERGSHVAREELNAALYYSDTLYVCILFTE
jgi:hypothetical protein